MVNSIIINRLKITASCAAALFALAALPVVSKAASQKAHMGNWAQKVEALHNYTDEASPLSMADSSAPDTFAGELAALHNPANELIYWQRDALQTASLPQLNLAQLKASKAAAQDQNCLSQAIYYEARSETVTGQKAVAEVVLNRVASKHFPNNICGVVYEGAERNTGCQFSFSCDGSMDIAPSGKSWERANLIAQHTLIGAHRPITLRATHYHTIDVNPHWAASVKPTRTIGEHKFYKFKTRRELAMTQSVAP